MRPFLKINLTPANPFPPGDIEHYYNLGLFAIDINERIDKLNVLVEEFNDPTMLSKQKEVLFEIYYYYQFLISRYPDLVIAAIPEAVNLFQIDGFNEIKRSFNNLGLTSIDKPYLEKSDIEIINANSNPEDRMAYNQLLAGDDQGFIHFFNENKSNIPKPFEEVISALTKEILPENKYRQLKILKILIRNFIATERPGPKGKELLRKLVSAVNSELNELLIHQESLGQNPLACTDFSKFLANMNPLKVSQLAKIFSLGMFFNRSELLTLYDSTDPGYNEWNDFLLGHSIIFLGGGNTQNFVVSNLIGSVNRFVLKVEQRLGAPKEIEQFLAEDVELSPKFSPKGAERQTTFLISGSTYRTTTIGITRIYELGDLPTIRARLNTAPTGKIQEKAASIYLQMAEFFKAILMRECAFPDPKNTNWLYDREGFLQISDSKSLMPAPKGMLEWSSDKRKLYPECPIHSNFLYPPEIKNDYLLRKKQIPADPVHAYCLGKNLYQFLTGCSCPYLKTTHDGSNFNFSSKIFYPPIGHVYQHLIEHLVKPDPSQRLSIEMAIDELNYIQKLISVKNAYRDLLINIRNYQVDSELNSQLIEQKLLEIRIPDDINFNSLHIAFKKELAKLTRKHQEQCIKLIDRLKFFRMDPLDPNDEYLDTITEKIIRLNDAKEGQKVHLELNNQLALLKQRYQNECQAMKEELSSQNFLTQVEDEVEDPLMDLQQLKELYNRFKTLLNSKKAPPKQSSNQHAFFSDPLFGVAPPDRDSKKTAPGEKTKTGSKPL